MNVSFQSKTVPVPPPRALAKRIDKYTRARTVHLFVFLDMPAGMHETQIAFEIMDEKDRCSIMAKVL